MIYLDHAATSWPKPAEVSEAMSNRVLSYPPETDIETLVNCCVTNRVRRVPIVKDGKVEGIVSRRDILREMQRIYSRHY